MCVLLPRQVDGLAALEKNLTVERLNRWLGSVRKQKVMVTLPKFKMTAEFNLGAIWNETVSAVISSGSTLAEL